MTHPRPTPWTAAQVRAVAACDVVGALVVLLASQAAGGRPTLADQVPWIDVAILGLVAATVANGCLFLVARRAVGARRAALLPDVPVPEPATEATEAGVWWWVPGTVRAHAGSCPLVAGKAATVVDAAQVRRRHLRRCEVCS